MFYVYILANTHNTTLYVGVTNNLYRRVLEHKQKLDRYSFSAKYNLEKLVYIEDYETIVEAITREKQLKAGSRDKKVKLIEETNPNWNDLSSFWWENIT